MPYFGDLTIFLATVMSALSLVSYVVVWRGNRQWRNLARLFFCTSALSISLALAALLYLILVHDFSVAYVFSYSSTDLPLGYLIASLWGGQQGTFLLWVCLVAIMGVVMMRTAGRFEVGNMVFLNLFVLSLLAILLKKSPFELLPVVRTEGAGLNPLLQDFWMTIHPPIMFIGFAATTFPFCFAMTGLVSRRYNDWAESARRWTMFAWLALGVSLVMGGYWAYKTLGWGGFWAWDPVENSSFIPWVFLTAQVHALFIKRQRRGLMRFSIFVVCLSFWSVLYGTFLTRSGVLADFSVHSFVDLGINQFLVIGLSGFIALGSFLLILRWNDIRPEPSYSRVNSRSYLVTLGIVILFIGGMLVLLGTSAPLLTRLTENPSNVGLSYYFATMTPVAIAVLVLLALFPTFRWNQGLSRPSLFLIGGAIGLVTSFVLLLSGVTDQIIYLLLFGAAGWALTANGYVVAASLRAGNFQPGYLAHVGLAVALVGAAVSAGFETKRTYTLPQGETVDAMGYQMRFVNVVETPRGFECHVEVTHGDSRFAAVLPHELPRNMEGVMKKPHVEKFLGYDFYLSPLSLEQPDAAALGNVTLLKGESATIDKYEITFHDFELDSHGEEMMSSAAALLTVRYDDRVEDLAPSLEVTDEGLEAKSATFDYDRATVTIAGVRPEEGGVVLQVSGDFGPAADPADASLVVELSEKPLINLFWLGTIILFFAGYLSMRERRKRRRPALTVDESHAESDRSVPSRVS